MREKNVSSRPMLTGAVPGSPSGNCSGSGCGDELVQLKRMRRGEARRLAQPYRMWASAPQTCGDESWRCLGCGQWCLRRYSQAAYSSFQ